MGAEGRTAIHASAGVSSTQWGATMRGLHRKEAPHHTCTSTYALVFAIVIADVRVSAASDSSNPTPDARVAAVSASSSESF